MSVVYPFEKMKLELRQRILAGEWAFGSRLPSSRQLARQYACSVNTVERAIRDLVTEGLLKRENRKGTYIANGVTGFNNKSGLIATFATELNHPLWASALKGIEDFIQPFGYNLMVASDSQDGRKLENLVRNIIAKRVDGVILSPIDDLNRENSNEMLLSMLQNNGIKIVFFDRYLYNSNIPYVCSDNLKGAYRLTQYLIENGHRRILFIRKSNSTSVKERMAGYQQALLDKGLDYDEGLNVLFSREDRDSFSQLKEKMRQLEYSAVIAVNCEVAQYAYQILHEMNLKIPANVTLVTFDPELAPFYQIPLKLTGITQSFSEMGRVAARLLLHLIEEKETFSIAGQICATQLEIGASVKTVGG